MCPQDRSFVSDLLGSLPTRTAIYCLCLFWLQGLATCAPIPAVHRGPGSLVIAVPMAGTLRQLRSAINEGVDHVIGRDPRAANSGAWRAEVIPGDVPTLQIVWTP